MGSDPKVEEIKKHLKEKHGFDADKELEKIRNTFSEEIRTLVGNYIRNEKIAGKTIEEINPWRLVDSNRLGILLRKIEDYKYSSSKEAQTVALLIIEQELSRQYGEDYRTYTKTHPEELRADENLEESMKEHYTCGLYERMKKEEIDREKQLKFWMEMINKKDPWKGVRLVRRDGKALVIKRTEEEIRQRIDRAIEEYL